MGIIFQSGLGIGGVPNNIYTPKFGQFLLATGDFGYQPAWTNGVLSLPVLDGANIGDNNPNDVTNGPVGIYINALDAAGNGQYMLQNLLNQSGTLLLKQGSNQITYTYSSGSFQAGTEYGLGEIGWDPSSGPLTITSTSNTTFNGYSGGDFNFGGGPLTYSGSSIPPNNSQLVDIIIHTDFTFVLTSDMFVTLNNVGDTNYGSPNGLTGFTVAQTHAYLDCGVVGQTINNSSITTVFVNAGVGQYDGSGYICSVEWGPGSSVPRGVAKVAYGSNNGYITICPVDPSDSNYGNNDGNSAGTPLTGTFNFPATFTLLNPLDNKGGWC
jgi:hypothetical protein